MKKFICMLTVLSSLTIFAGCAETSDSSIDTSPAETTEAETEEATETTEGTTEPTTESAPSLDLDTEYTFENISLKVPSSCTVDSNSTSTGESYVVTFSDSSVLQVAVVDNTTDTPLANVSDDDKMAVLTAYADAFLSDDYWQASTDLESVEIKDVSMLKQEVFSEDLIYVALYHFIYGENIYTLGFSETMGVGYIAFNLRNDILNTIEFNDLGADVVERTVETQTEPPTTESLTTQPIVTTQSARNTVHFILNTETNCVHYSSKCSAAKAILPENYQEIDLYTDELATYEGVYWACGKCSQRYRDELPPIE